MCWCSCSGIVWGFLWTKDGIAAIHPEHLIQSECIYQVGLWCSGCIFGNFYNVCPIIVLKIVDDKKRYKRGQISIITRSVLKIRTKSKQFKRTKAKRLVSWLWSIFSLIMKHKRNIRKWKVTIQTESKFVLRLLVGVDESFIDFILTYQSMLMKKNIPLKTKNWCSRSFGHKFGLIKINYLDAYSWFRHIKLVIVIAVIAKEWIILSRSNDSYAAWPIPWNLRTMRKY